MRIHADTTPNSRLLHGDVTGHVIAAFYSVYNDLGHGFLEAVYSRALEVEFQRRNMEYRREYGMTVFYLGQDVGTCRSDFLVEEKVIVEVKATASVAAAHQQQLQHYLKATRAPVGLLLNFGVKARFFRAINPYRQV